jgi:hypothetical protein
MRRTEVGILLRSCNGSKQPVIDPKLTLPTTQTLGKEQDIDGGE